MFQIDIWPLGEGETNYGEYPETHKFYELPSALLYAVGEIADMADALIDPDNGDAPSDENDHGGIADYCRNGSRTAFQSIYDAAYNYYFDKPRFPVKIVGASNEVIIVTEIS